MVSNLSVPVHSGTNFQQKTYPQKLRFAATEGGTTLRAVLTDVRGAAYMNDLGEGLKPTIGNAFAKRFWYPTLGYITASVYDKTMRDENGNKDISLARGGKELAFQTLASLCGPILLVNFGQNTIGRSLTGMGALVKEIKSGKNPFKNMSLSSVASGSKKMLSVTAKGIVNAAKELPHDIWNTIKLACNDILHPKESCKKIKNFIAGVGEKLKNVPKKAKKSYEMFKMNKSGYLFGKNGILFGTKGLFGEKGLLFGSKSGKVIGGLLAILLLYKPVDKFAEHIVELPEKVIKG